MSGPQVYFGLPPKELFTFPPANLPASLPPPIKERTFRAPFGISPWLFNLAMRPEVPFLFAATYIVTVFALNAWNRQRNHKPWWIARQPFFKPFVVLHNVVLAIYSAATFFAMLRAFSHTWPGFNNPSGLAGIADSMCKIHGPRGLGDAATYNSTINIWESKNELIRMSRNGNPDPTDVGRLWNEGLAFWGWIFYLSKFYEVLDTFIIVAKGKRSATLQTYHHAGAMLCMWAGMRYMSPPIWMFVFINSFIHALMYTYFTLTAINVRVPKSIKRFLTTLQIAQFIWGASYAAIHLFVQYDIPIATPYKVLATVSSVAASATSAVASATSEVSKVIESPAATASIGALIKKFLLRAAGEEGIAERVGIPHDNKPVSQHIEERMEQLHHHVVPAGPQYETRWRTEWTKVNCIDTSGEAFAIYLNLFYLFPLTVLFARFFYKAYMKRTSRPRGASQNAKAITQDARTAERETEKAVEAAGKRAEDQMRNSGAKAQEKTRDLAKELREDVQKFKEGGKFQSRRVSQAIENFEQKVQQTADSIGDAASPTSTPKKSSPKKKNNNNKKNKQGGGDDSRPSTPQKSNDQSNEKSNEPDVKDDLAPKVDLKPEDGDASADVEKSDAPEPSDKENQPPATPERKQKKNAQPKKDEEDQQSKDQQPKNQQSKDQQSKDQQSKDSQSQKEDDQTSNAPNRKQSKNSQSKNSQPKKEDSDADDSQSGLLSPSKKGEKPTAETSKVPAEDESAEKQDANLEASEPTRPAPEDDSHDTLSQSASFINYSELSGDAMKLSEYEDEAPAKSTA